MKVQVNEFNHLIVFDKAARAQKLCRDTDGLIDVNSTDDGDSLTLDTEDTGYTVEIASRQVSNRETSPTTSRVLLRDHAECKRNTTYESSLRFAFIVGIVTDREGKPVFSFEATKTTLGWHITGKRFKYTVDSCVSNTL